MDRDVRQIARAVRAARAPGGMATRIVAVDGFGGAGKSTLAASLSAELDQCPVLPTDEFASWEDPLGWWPRLLLEVLEPMAAGQPVRYQARDWGTGGLGEWRAVPEHPFLVLEDVSCSRAAFQPYVTYAVWVECPRAERLRRGLERDGPAARLAWEAGWPKRTHGQPTSGHGSTSARRCLVGATARPPSADRSAGTAPRGARSR